MAQLFDARARITDGNNIPISNGKLRIYETATTTLADVFSDAGLAVPLVNPVVADINGLLPAIFAPEGTTVDTDMLTAAGVVIPDRGVVGGSFVGSDDATFVKDFTNSRFQVYGAGGIVNIETGSPSPDDVGGHGRIGGWDGTQGDDLELDYALTNTTGKFKEDGKKLSSIVYTEATTFTAVAALDIVLPNDPVGCRVWEVEVFDLVQSASGELRARLSYDGGATYRSGASDYKGQYSTQSSNVGTVASSTSPALDYLFFGAGYTAVANKPANGAIRFLTPRTGNDMTRVRSRFSGEEGGTGYQIIYSMDGVGPASAGPCDHIRIYPVSGTITGKYMVRPMRGFGEV